jgi:hypothetical protein
MNVDTGIVGSIFAVFLIYIVIIQFETEGTISFV